MLIAIAVLSVYPCQAMKQRAPCPCHQRIYCYDETLCDPFSMDNFLQVAGIHINCLSSRKSDEVFICHQLEEVVFSTAFPPESREPSLARIQGCVWGEGS